MVNLYRYVVVFLLRRAALASSSDGTKPSRRSVIKRKHSDYPGEWPTNGAGSSERPQQKQALDLCLGGALSGGSDATTRQSWVYEDSNV